jgi:hypothetical protein
MKAGFEQMDIENPLQDLGFEDGELEMFFNDNPDVSSEQLIQRYLEISREEPFNLDWESVENAILASYMTGAFKPNGIQYTKHDIAKVVLESFDDIQEGGYKKRQRKIRKTKRRKTKKSKKRKTRRH